jgi:hypothetical protein
MSDRDEIPTPARCVFCRMPTPDRFLHVPMCPICRDQSYDFLLVSGVQVLMAPIVGISGLQFLSQELLMFFVLIFVKHRITPPWERGT